MSRSPAIRWVLLIVAIAALGYLGWQRFHGENHAEAQKPVPARAAVPVRTTSVEKADFPVYLTGLGTVQGFNTVVVRTRVDGQINRIEASMALAPSDGIFGFASRDVRSLVAAVGTIAGQCYWTLVVLAVISALTVAWRLIYLRRTVA